MLTLKSKTVDVPDIGKVVISELTAAAYEEYQLALIKSEEHIKKGSGYYRGFSYLLLAFCVTNEKGERIWSKDDVASLPRRICAPLMKEAQELNGEGDVEGN